MLVADMGSTSRGLMYAVYWFDKGKEKTATGGNWNREVERSGSRCRFEVIYCDRFEIFGVSLLCRACLPFMAVGLFTFDRRSGAILDPVMSRSWRSTHVKLALLREMPVPRLVNSATAM